MQLIYLLLLFYIYLSVGLFLFCKLVYLPLLNSNVKRDGNWSSHKYVALSFLSYFNPKNWISPYVEKWCYSFVN